MVVVKYFGCVLILLLFVCGLDCVWFFYKGRYFGVLFKFLFVCFADYVFKIEELYEFV